ncbi:cyclic pyranopterin monophosphate synthase MoaC [Thalassotalea sp. 1_MG-2023]|uniref:cyclic pyranopterin monophosphate synthase MoaC n=1 Tax=Thalassotalea sp. 1_MG-2023 TaxID=3062680 RepID=UPI0026E2921A|nr:cyclic pyranopterin monophosphate synthase MoaC [Thalassotalea sp. 1_MG-2023]MDO6426410.1 cyclic pyranopterin monophosphate synthase MoaC [Thalassotalea sp. 1_MG-2023]
MSNSSANTLSHINQQGDANMVDVTDKATTARVAMAEGFIKMTRETLTLITQGNNKKGDVLSVARIAGIQAAKKCSDLIPLCHPLMLTKVQVDFTLDEDNTCIRVESLCKLSGQTGVEMEALTAVSVACLTLFDMCKAADPAMEIFGIKVLSKTGGKSGHWQPNSKEHL